MEMLWAAGWIFSSGGEPLEQQARQNTAKNYFPRQSSVDRQISSQFDAHSRALCAKQSPPDENIEGLLSFETPKVSVYSSACLWGSDLSPSLPLRLLSDVRFFHYPPTSLQLLWEEIVLLLSKHRKRDIFICLYVFFFFFLDCAFFFFLSQWKWFECVTRDNVDRLICTKWILWQLLWETYLKCLYYFTRELQPQDFATDRVTYYVTESNKLWIPKYGHSETTCMNLSELFPTLECIWKCIILNIVSFNTAQFLYFNCGN